MKNKILATTIGMILAGGMGMAQADVTITGNVNVSIDSEDVDGGSDDINMSSNTSSIMVKGSEDLGNGLSAIFAVDFEFEADERSTTGTVDRDQWVGLKGAFGSVKFGTISTSYKSHGAMVDPLYRTSLQGRDHGIQSSMHSGANDNGDGGRMTNHIRYDSPNFSGFKATVDYSFDSLETDGTDDDAYGIGGQYSNGPVLVFADYITSAHGGDDDAWKVGGKYSMDMFSFYGQYEVDGGLLGQGATEGVSNNNISEADVWHLGASATLGNTLVYFGFANGDDNNNAAQNTEYKAWTLAVDHHLSKRTDAYAGFNQVDCESNVAGPCSGKGLAATGGEIDFMSVGLRHKF